MLTKSTAMYLAILASASTFSLAEPVAIQSNTPYAADAKVAQNIRTECTKLGSQLAEFTKQFSEKSGVDIALADSIDINQKGRVLQIELTDAVSMGNAFTGHQKATSARGTLYEDGKKIASFEARRQSMGGAFAGYKGSCSVLGRTVKAMGKDISLWLKQPNDNALLGDL
jgi:hypothetical protein